MEVTDMATGLAACILRSSLAGLVAPVQNKEPTSDSEHVLADGRLGVKGDFSFLAELFF